MFTIFFRSTGVVHISFIKKGETVDHEKYIKNCLKLMVTTLKKERKLTGVKNMKILHDNARPPCTFKCA